jgi:SAM-dependent methyltransferase
MDRTRSAIGIDEDIYARHWRWLGDLSSKRVLDLGCYAGNVLSLSIAERSRSYLGIDLSRPAIERLRAKLQAKNLAHADAKAVDFLDPKFSEAGFDVIYACSVAHHFKHFDTFLAVLSEKLVASGIVITFDPLQTSIPVRISRALYRPFQTDSDWEWPFTKQTFEQIQERFEIPAVQGIMGYAKWCLPLSLVSRRMAVRAGKALHAKDLEFGCREGPGLWRCMQVTMCWRKRLETEMQGLGERGR